MARDVREAAKLYQEVAQRRNVAAMRVQVWNTSALLGGGVYIYSGSSLSNGDRCNFTGMKNPTRGAVSYSQGSFEMRGTIFDSCVDAGQASLSLTGLYEPPHRCQFTNPEG
jgi:hypothetical protein